MNKTLLSISFMMVFAAMLTAQSFSIEPIPTLGEANLQDPSTYPGDVVAHAEVINNTSETLNLSWIRTELVMPAGWATGVCDVNYCYDIDVARRDFQLPANSKGTLDVHGYPGGIPGSLENGAIPGEAVVHIRVTNKDNPTDTISGVFNFNVTGDPIVSIDEVELKKLSLFPNPTSDYFELSSLIDNEIATVAVHNILGSQVRLYNASERRFEVGDLPNGMYLVSLQDEQNAVLKTLRLQKR